MSTAVEATPQAPSIDLREGLTRSLLALTFATGMIDAVSYLGLGRVFAANMTGNIVLLAFGIARAGGLPVLAPAVSLVAFLVGAAAGGRLARRVAGRAPAQLAWPIAVETALLLAAVIVSIAVHIQAGTESAYLTIALLGLGMGVRNASVRALAVPDLTTTVLTLTLTGFAADSPLGGGSGKGTLRRSAAVLAMLFGALAGALLLKAHSGLTLALAATAGVTLAALLGYVFAATRPS
jgi:uncharacterized membrane protein YoaK (UPF0700 family)